VHKQGLSRHLPDSVLGVSASRAGVKVQGDQAALQQLAGVLSVLVREVMLLGLLAVAFGPAYCYTALRLAYSTRWSESEAPRVLAVYCGYILLLAVNGEKLKGCCRTGGSGACGNGHSGGRRKHVQRGCLFSPEAELSRLTMAKTQVSRQSSFLLPE